MESIRISRFLLAIGGILLALAFWVAWGLWQEADAHDRYWRWDDGNITPLVTSVNNPYGSANYNAANDYDSNTDIAVDWCNSPCQFNIRFIGDNWGETGWAAMANPMHDGVRCIINSVWSSRRCNKTDLQVNSATVNWNSHYYGYTVSYTNFAARHELGHVFGLTHIECGTEDSVMVKANCGNRADTLQPHDIDDINEEY